MKKLELQFKNEEGKTVTFSVDDPIEPVDTAMINAAMDEVVQQNLFQTKGGDLVEKHAARIVERTVEDIDLEN